jgi:hypothetical protein
MKSYASIDELLADKRSRFSHCKYTQSGHYEYYKVLLSGKQCRLLRKTFTTTGGTSKHFIPKKKKRSDE